MAANADRNLLFGILALQNDFITRDQLVEAMHAWVLAKHRLLGELLRERGALKEDQYDLLDALVAMQLVKHGGDAEKTLHALSSASSAKAVLAVVADADLQASLSHVGSVDVSSTVDYRPATLAAGQRYRILRPHAKGGLGEVFVAEDAELHREVAVKEMQERHALDAHSRGRFLLEAEITGRLEHPGIVPVYGLGTYGDGRPFYAMRFVKGDNFKQAIEAFHATKKGFDSVEFRRLLGRFLDMCNAVAYAHSRGVLHRDLKPGNVMLGQFGETLVVDWGLAKVVGRPDAGLAPGSDDATLQPSSGSDLAATAAGAIVGTPAFMSPEQAEGKLDQLGPTTDVYSLGATLYALLTGQPPIQNDGLEMIQQVIRGEIPSPVSIRPDVPKPLAAICQKAMALRPAARYPSASVLAVELERWLADEPVGAYPEPWRTRLRRWTRKRRTLVTSAAAVLVVTTAVASVASWFLIHAYRNEQAANSQAQASRAAAERQRDRAQRNLARARQAVDRLLSRVSADLFAVPQTEPLRRSLLEDALAFHLQFEREEGDDPEVRREAAAAREQLGRLYDDLGRFADAEKAFRDALTVREQLAVSPGAPEDVSELSSIHNHLGTLFHDAQRFAESEHHFVESLRHHERLPADFPDSNENGHTRAQLVNNLGNLHFAAGRYEQAAQEFRKAIALHKPLIAAHPDRPGYLEDLSLHQSNLANALEKLRRPAEAEAAGLDAVRSCEHLLEKYPNHPPYQERLADTHFRLAQIAEQAKERQVSETHFQKAQAIYEQLAANFPFVTRHFYSLGLTLNNRGLLARDKGDVAPARDLLERAVGAQRRALQLAPQYRDARINLRKHYDNLLDVLHTQGDYATTAARAEEMARDLAKDGSAVAAAARALVAVPGEASAKRAIALLDKATAAGFADYEELINDDKWARLRERSDFRDLTSKLGDKVRSRALHLAERAAAERPNDPRLQSGLADELDNHGLWHRFCRRWGDAEASYRRSLEVRQRLAGAHPNDADYRVRLAGTYCNLGHFLCDAPGRLGDARKEFDRAAAFLLPLLTDLNEGATARLFLRNVELGRGDLAANQAKWPEAVAAYSRGLSHCQPKHRTPILLLRAVAFARTGDHRAAAADADEAAGGARQSAGDRYTLARAYALAAAAVGPGELADSYAVKALDQLHRLPTADFAQLKADNDLAALRTRPGFQKLLAELEATQKTSNSKATAPASKK